MAHIPKELPRDVQSHMHDIIDEYGEKVARGTMAAIELVKPASGPPVNECSCKRYSQKKPGGHVSFWNERDPKCEYFHLAPMSDRVYSVPL